MKKPQRLGNNSTSHVAKVFAGAIEDVPVPEGVELRTEEERVIWRQFSRARAREDWRDLDLVLIAKIVNYEADIRRYKKQLECEGVISVNERGTRHKNPLFDVIYSLQQQQLAVIRSLSLTQTGSDPRTINAQAVKENTARKIIQQNGPESLLASPIN